MANSIILCFSKHQLTQVHLESGRRNGEREICCYGAVVEYFSGLVFFETHVREYFWGWHMGPFIRLSLRGCKKPRPLWDMEHGLPVKIEWWLCRWLRFE